MILSKPSANAKTKKMTEEHGVMVYTLQLLPHSFIFDLVKPDKNPYKIKTLCPKATEGCKATCLAFTGRADFYKPEDPRNKVIKARMRRTKHFIENPQSFIEHVSKEISNAKKLADKKNKKLAVRLNCFSDILWEHKKYALLDGKTILEHHNDIMFYDYTKILNRKVPDNYHITFSRSGTNDKECIKALEKGWNVSVVFRESLPDKFFNHKVIDGDIHDFRFMDPKPSVVGLKFKGRRENLSSFVV